MIAGALAAFLNPMCDDEDGGYALRKVAEMKAGLYVKQQRRLRF